MGKKNRQLAKTDGRKEIKILRKNLKEMLEIRNIVREMKKNAFGVLHTRLNMAKERNSE